MSFQDQDPNHFEQWLSMAFPTFSISKIVQEPFRTPQKSDKTEEPRLWAWQLSTFTRFRPLRDPELRNAPHPEETRNGQISEDPRWSQAA